ncbi:MAG: MarR family transcriptional regulator [Spirochaetaceae bacterium]|nr:MarR family transcriptional regulator [Spirochaetaceae bacterium]
MVKQELKIFIAMNRALNLINKTNFKVLHKYKLTAPQFALIEALYHKGDLSVGEVQEKILSTSGTIAVIIKNLEKDNLITRYQDKNDKRKYILSISEKGQLLMDKVYPEIEDNIISQISVLDEREQNILLKYLKKLTGYKL